MRQEQFDLLQQRAEQLTDIFLKEADPDNWPGKGIEDANMDAKTRGDRYWTKKNAFATMSLVQRIITVTGALRLNTLAGADGEKDPGAVKEHEQDDLEAEAAAAEKEASKMLKKAKASAKNTVVHGKA